MFTTTNLETTVSWVWFVAEYMGEYEYGEHEYAPVSIPKLKVDAEALLEEKKAQELRKPEAERKTYVLIRRTTTITDEVV